jgi:hypothetical protein
VPSAHAIKTRVNNFEETGSTVKMKGGSVKQFAPTQHWLSESIIRTNSSPDVIFRVEYNVLCFFYVLCYVSRPLIRLFLQMLKYVLPYKCNCIIISNTFNFLLTLKIARFAGVPCILLYESFSRYLPVARLGNFLQNCKDHCDSHVLPITHAPHFLPEYASVTLSQS